MSAPQPKSRPQQTHEQCVEILKKHGSPDAPIRILVVRSYFRRTLGDPDKNDRGMYDDACFLVLKDRTVSFNFNADPSRYKPGHGKGSAKGMANLKPGLYRNVYMMAKHKGQYDAICQRGGPVTVLRDADSQVPEKDIVVVEGRRYYEHTGMFGINFHRGGINGTSSLGCNTWPVDQYKEAMDLIYSTMRKHGMKYVDVCLVWDK